MAEVENTESKQDAGEQQGESQQQTTQVSVTTPSGKVYSVTVLADAEKGEYFPGVPSKIGSIEELRAVRENAYIFSAGWFKVTEGEGDKARVLTADELMAVLDEPQPVAAVPQSPPADGPVNGQEAGNRRGGRAQANR